MPMYQTSYKRADQGAVTTECYARDLEHLRELMVLRGMGEVSTGKKLCKVKFSGRRCWPDPQMPSNLIRQGKYAAAAHAATWVGMIAERSGLVSAWDLLGDGGLIHETVHLLTESTAPGFAYELSVRWRDLEQRVPGVHPCWAEPLPYRAAA